MRRLRRMAGALALLSLAPVCALAGSVQPVTDAAALAAQARQRMEQADFRASGRLVRISAAGERVSTKFTLKGHWFPDGLRLLYEVNDPAASRMGLLLHMSPTGGMVMDGARTGSNVATRLGSEHGRDRWLGSGFAFEDLVDGQFFWKKQELLPAAKFGTRNCLMLQSTPAEVDHSRYGSVTSCVDSAMGLPVHVVKTVRGSGNSGSSGSTKEFTYSGFRQVGGAWVASDIEVKVEGEGGSTLLLLEHGSAKAKLGRGDFDLGQATAAGEE